TRNNPLVELAERFQMKTVATSYDSGTLYGVDGKRRGDEDVLEKKLAKLLEAVDEEREEAADEGEPDIALAAALERHLPRAGTHARQDLEFAINAVIEQEYAASVADLSLYHWDDDESDGGGDVMFPDGYDALPRGLAD